MVDMLLPYCSLTGPTYEIVQRQHNTEVLAQGLCKRTWTFVRARLAASLQKRILCGLPTITLQSGVKLSEELFLPFLGV
jgi:hypothetical protein